MITYTDSDLFLSPAQAIVNTVNTVGVMGKGIAREFKAIYPDMFQDYQAKCESGTFTIGDLLYYRTRNKTVINLPTKQHWRGRSRVEYVEAGLKAFVSSYRAEGITSVAFPQLGCGNGELDWETAVRPLMVRYLGPLSIPIYIHIYGSRNPVEHRNVGEMKQWLRTEPRSLGFVEFWDDLVDVLERRGFERTVTDGGVSGERDDFIVVRGEHHTVSIERSDWLDTWNNLRVAGFMTISDLGNAFAGVEQTVLDCFLDLPYVAPVSIAVSEGRVELEPWANRSDQPDTNGVQLLPHLIRTRVSSEPELVEVQSALPLLALGG